MAATSGFNAYTQYGYESSFKTASSETNYKPFAFGVSISRTANNNPVTVYGIGNKNATASTPGVFQGEATVSGYLADPWWLRMFFGAPADAGAGPYTHTYTEAAQPDSFTTELGFELGATDSMIQMLGCVATSISLTASVGEPIAYELAYGYVDAAETSSLGTIRSLSYAEPFFFQQGEINSGGVLSQVTEFSLTIEQNPIMVNAIGTRETQAFTFGQRVYNFTFTKSYLDDTTIEEFYGGSTPAATPTDDYLGPAQSSATLTFNNGQAGTAQKQLVITLANLFYNEHSTEVSSEDVIQETVTGYALSLTSAVATDNTSAPPN